MNIETALAFLTIIGQILIVLIFVSSFFSSWPRRFFGKFGLIISFFIALVSMLLSLYFSEIVLWEPCVLCWYQRIAMYPLVVIFAVGVWKQDVSARTYGLALSSIGLIISIYQIYLQILGATGVESSGFCSAIGAADCSEIYMLEFGYVTFPVMAATAFIAIILIQLLGSRDTISS